MKVKVLGKITPEESVDESTTFSFRVDKEVYIRIKTLEKILINESKSAIIKKAVNIGFDNILLSHIQNELFSTTKEIFPAMKLKFARMESEENEDEAPFVSEEPDSFSSLVNYSLGYPEYESKSKDIECCLDCFSIRLEREGKNTLLLKGSFNHVLAYAIDTQVDPDLFFKFSQLVAKRNFRLELGENYPGIITHQISFEYKVGFEWSNWMGEYKNQLHTVKDLIGDLDALFASKNLIKRKNINIKI